jgi:hypothetical protein
MAPSVSEGSGPGADDDQVFTYASKQGYVVLSSDERARCGGDGSIASTVIHSPGCFAGPSATAIA